MKFYTYTGVVDFPSSAPSLRSIAVSLSRESRYAGASIEWWPVALHTFVVCDLLPVRLQIHGLLHDAAECVTGDIPKPAKTKDIEKLEVKLTLAIYAQLGVTPPCDADAQVVHQADRRALHGEVHTIGTASLRELYPHDREVERLVWQYSEAYPPLACIDPKGTCVREFMNRFKVYSKT